MHWSVSTRNTELILRLSSSSDRSWWKNSRDFSWTSTPCKRLWLCHQRTKLAPHLQMEASLPFRSTKIATGYGLSHLAKPRCGLGSFESTKSMLFKSDLGLILVLAG